MQIRQQDSGVVAWGSYDESKPRVRLLLAELEAQGVLRARINIPAWTGMRDKAVAGRGEVLKRLARLAAGYPLALVKLLRQPSGGAVLLGYPAIPDVFAAWPVARLRRRKIVFDAFIPLHDTLVGDRAMVAASSFAAKLSRAVEWLALHLADIILVDTDQHGEFFAREYDIPRERFQTVLVGAEAAFWDARHLPIQAHEGELLTVLFYGQLIPLHGLETILDAIKHTEDQPIRWLLIGSGQEEPKLRQFLEEYGGEKVSWTPWVEYERLPEIIRSADVALGIFGTSDKAARVVPNKAFQVLAVGTPLITRESAAIEPLAKRYPQAIRTVPAGDGEALAKAVRAALRTFQSYEPLPTTAEAELGPASASEELLARLHCR